MFRSNKISLRISARKWLFALIALLNFDLAFAESRIPTFTPNVVDPSNYLAPSEVNEINSALESIREKADIFGAVFVVSSLEGDSIENLAEKAFNQWELGDKKKDNGLLLVLAIKDRRSRFEVGYGLEGPLPDIYAKRVLDQELAPKMRNGDYKLAIINSFKAMALARTKDPYFEEGLSGSLESLSSDELELNNLYYGFWSWLIYVALLWGGIPLVNLRKRQLSRALAKNPLTQMNYTSSASPTSETEENVVLIYFRKFFELLGFVFLRTFFTINPGAFVYIIVGIVGAVVGGWAAGLIVVAGLLIFLRYYLKQTKPFRSIEALEEYRREESRKIRKQINKGYYKESSPGIFTKTNKYYSDYSTGYRSGGGSSGSSRSSFSSSSGGGSSGGGGASSSW